MQMVRGRCQGPSPLQGHVEKPTMVGFEGETERQSSRGSPRDNGEDELLLARREREESCGLVR